MHDIRVELQHNGRDAEIGWVLVDHERASGITGGPVHGEFPPGDASAIGPF
jgi:hypothetical protein